jgi:RNA methyltransferase, TrmH family
LTSIVAQLRPLIQLSTTNKDNAAKPEIDPCAGEFVRAASPHGDEAAHSPLNIGGPGGAPPQIRVLLDQPDTSFKFRTTVPAKIENNSLPWQFMSSAFPDSSILTSTQNPLVKGIRRLHQTKERQREQVFLLEGTHLLQEACAVHWPLETLCATPDWRSTHPQLWQTASQQSTRVELVGEKALAAMATTVHPDGVIAVAKRQSDRSPAPDGDLLLMLDRLQDPGNLGTIIRTAAAAGAAGIWTSTDSVELDHPKVLRASAGQWFRLPMEIGHQPLDLIRRYRQTGGQIVATAMAGAVDYWQVDFTQPTLILLGNEGAGLPPELIAEADRTVRVPMAPAVESLNVSITAALLLYEALRQRQAKGR